jgi:hypothetical protein
VWATAATELPATATAPATATGSSDKAKENEAGTDQDAVVVRAASNKVLTARGASPLGGDNGNLTSIGANLRSNSGSLTKRLAPANASERRVGVNKQVLVTNVVMLGGDF